MFVNGILFRDSNLPLHGEVSAGGELLFGGVHEEYLLGGSTLKKEATTTPEILDIVGRGRQTQLY
jgi:hypothetical protein